MINKENWNINENVVPMSKENNSNFDNEDDNTETTENSKKSSWTKNNIDINIKKVIYLILITKNIKKQMSN